MDKPNQDSLNGTTAAIIIAAIHAQLLKMEEVPEAIRKVRAALAEAAA